MRPGKVKAKEIVNLLLNEQSTIQAGDLVRKTGISRQAAHRHLAALVKDGFLLHAGWGRGSRYRRPGSSGSHYRFPLQGLAEERAWSEVRAKAAALQGLSENIDHILEYAMTELLNNAIEHSGGSQVEIRVFPSSPLLALEVVDDGVGIFEHLRSRLGLPDVYGAVQELSKGKVTTLPERHSGEGIFFSSKIADVFLIESGTLRWQIDNLRGDSSLGTIDLRQGTRVRFEVAPDKTRSLADLFAEYTRDFEFAKTKIVVKLFESGVRFISRSEAKRLLQGLEKFRELVLDFQGVQEIGQGFADEVFRVWPSFHPGIAIEAVRMAPAVEFMVKRARPRAP